MSEAKAQVRDIVQIAPHVDRFGSCLLVVSEVKHWGVQGYVKIPAGGEAYFRVKWEDVEPTGGRAQWVPNHEANAD